MKPRFFTLPLLAFCLLTVMPTLRGAVGDELSDAIDALKSAAEKLVNDAELVKRCEGFTKTPELCDAADAPDSDPNPLICPPGEVTETEHECSLVDSAELKAALGTKSKQILGLSGKFKVEMKLLGQERSQPFHIHRPDGNPTSCGERYVKRQDSVTLYFAAYQEGKVSATAPTSQGGIDDYVAEVEANKGRAFKHGPVHYCIWEDHKPPRECGTDCNTNNIPDPDESGRDCDSNQIPDECQQSDCNQNGTLDSCETESGNSPDCDGNSVPDDCETQGGIDFGADSPFVPISDNTTVETPPITLTGNAPVGDVDVGLFIQHTWIGDLQIELVKPPTSVMLAQNRGGSFDDYPGTIFDDEAPQSIQTAPPPFFGRYRPESPLSAFDDSDSSGPWTLRVSDTAAQDTGMIMQWFLHITHRAAADCNLNGTVDMCEGSGDCNTNGVPDVCETLADDNQNGTPDMCDIATGASGDCNSNGVPDELELSALDELHRQNVIPDDSGVGGQGLLAVGSSLPDNFVAVDNFMFGAATHIQQVEWQSLAFNNATDCPGFDVVEIRFYDSVGGPGGAPGTLLAVYPNVPHTKSLNPRPPILGVYPVYDNSGTLAPGFPAQPGLEYWMAIVGDYAPGGCPGTYGWVVSPDAPPGDMLSYQATPQTGGTFMPNDADLAMVLYGGAPNAGDCDTNGTPDACEDLNGNGVADACDIASGQSQDVDGDGVPDEVCAFDRGDMNANGTLDGDDIQGFVNCLFGLPPPACVRRACADMNGDGLVDDCDLRIFVGHLKVGAVPQ